MKKLLSAILALLFVAGVTLTSGCEQLGLTDTKKDDNSLMLLLGLAALQGGGASSSGFFVTIPNGVAK